MDRVLARAARHAQVAPPAETIRRQGVHVTEAQGAANLARILGAVLIKKTDPRTGKEIR